MIRRHTKTKRGNPQQRIVAFGDRDVDTRCGVFGIYPGDLIYISDASSIILPTGYYFVLGMDVTDDDGSICILPAKVKTYKKDLKHPVDGRYITEVIIPKEEITWLIPNGDIFSTWTMFTDKTIIRGNTGHFVTVCRYGIHHLHEMHEYSYSRIIDQLQDLLVTTPSVDMLSYID